jgi:radical SAM superfamily enzyme YgiQ (UPF0313 family)
MHSTKLLYGEVQMAATTRMLLIATNVETEPYPVYPIGAAIVANALAAHGLHVTALDFACTVDPLKATWAGMEEHQPDLIGISLRAVDTTSSVDPRSYLEPVRELIVSIRSRWATPIVLGGAGFSLFPELLLRELGADYGVIGEGEQTVLELVDRLRTGDDPAGLPGTVVRKGDSVVRGPARPALPPESWSQPSIDHFPVAPHLAAGGMASVQSKRGCPLDCSYCTYPELEGRRLRLRDPAAVAGEVAALVERGVDYLFFVDNNFNIPAEHATAICGELAALAHRPEWTAFVTPNGFRENHAAEYAAAGARSLEFGSESGAAEVLEGLGKHHSAEDIRRCDSSCAGEGVTPAHYFIFCGPGENGDTVQQSLDLISELNGPAVAMLGIRVYPRTRLHQRAVAEGLVAAGDTLLDPRFYFSPRVDPEKVAERLSDFASQHRNFMLIGAENGLNRELAARLRKHGRRGPLWEFMRR